MMNIIREVGTGRFAAKQIMYMYFISMSYMPPLTGAVVTYRSTRQHAAKGILEDTKRRVGIQSHQQRVSLINILCYRIDNKRNYYFLQLFEVSKSCKKS